MQISLLLKKIWYLKDSRNGHFAMHYSSFLNVYPFDYTAGTEWEGGPVNQVNHTSWVAVFTPTDRP